MGEVSGATLLSADGATEEVAWENASNWDRGRIELHYEYREDLLEPGPDPGMWRYRTLLPLADGRVRYPLRVGGTPLLPVPGLREELGLNALWLKDETHGPSGSNKDRATALVVERALCEGGETVSCASTGNVAASLSIGAAAAGLRAVVFVPANVDNSKLTVMLLAAATVARVDAGYDETFALSREAAKRFGWVDRNTGVNPVTLEAKKTVAFEVWEQLGRRFPDVVVVPVGDGPTFSAMAKGFREIAACVGAQGVPRIVGVQAEGCQPIKQAWETGGPIRPVEPDTIADGIAVGDPISGAMVIRDVEVSGGALVVVADEDLLEGIRTLASRAGILAEPAGAASYAGLRDALDRGIVGRDEEVVILVTGTGLKTPRFLRPERSAMDVEASLGALEAALA